MKVWRNTYACGIIEGDTNEGDNMTLDTNIETLEPAQRLPGWDEPRLVGGKIVESAILSTSVEQTPAIEEIDDNPNIYKGWD